MRTDWPRRAELKQELGSMENAVTSGKFAVLSEQVDTQITSLIRIFWEYGLFLYGATSLDVNLGFVFDILQYITYFRVLQRILDAYFAVNK